MNLLVCALLWAESVAAPCHIHEPTGLEFATWAGRLLCAGPRVLDAKREEVSLAYRGRRMFTATVFVYRKLPPHSFPGEPLTAQIEAVRIEVARNYNAFECQPWTPKTRPGMSGLSRTGQSEDMVPHITFIAIEEIQGWWLKIRATAVADERESSERDLNAVVSSIRGRTQQEE